MNARIDISPEKVTAFCKRWQIAELALFGSVLRDDFDPESDVDVLVSCDSASAAHAFRLDANAR